MYTLSTVAGLYRLLLLWSSHIHMLELTASAAVLISWSGWKRAAAYFPATMHKTADLDPAGNYLFACHPHGITSFRQAMP